MSEVNVRQTVDAILRREAQRQPAIASRLGDEAMLYDITAHASAVYDQLSREKLGADVLAIECAVLRTLYSSP